MGLRTALGLKPTTAMSIADEIKAQDFWYHNLELAPGVWTESPYGHSPPATRGVLKNVDVSGMSILDIGAMEGLFSILPARRGAARIITTDRLDLSKKIDFVKRALDVKFDYQPNLALAKVRDVVLGKWGQLPDLTIYSGVLYHTFDPTGDVIRVRGLTRCGGIAIIETVAAISDEAALLYNNDFWIYSPGTYYIPTTGWLASMLPFAGLKPIDCRYFSFGERNGRTLCRIAVACRAVDIPAITKPLPKYATGDTSWYANDAVFDFGQYVDIGQLGGASSRIDYSATLDFQLSAIGLAAGGELVVDPNWNSLALTDIY